MQQLCRKMVGVHVAYGDIVLITTSWFRIVCDLFPLRLFHLFVWQVLCYILYLLDQIILSSFRLSVHFIYPSIHSFLPPSIKLLPLGHAVVRQYTRTPDLLLSILLLLNILLLLSFKLHVTSFFHDSVICI